METSRSPARRYKPIGDPNVQRRNHPNGLEGAHWNPRAAFCYSLDSRGAAAAGVVTYRTVKGMKASLVVFDLDGTVLDSVFDIASSVNVMRRRMGLDALPLSVIYGYVGDGAHMLVRRSLPTEAGEADVKQALAYFLEDYRVHMLDHTAPYPGVVETLMSMQGRTLCVLTNKLTGLTEAMLEKLDLLHHFQYVFGSDRFPRKKPDPIGVLYLLEATGIPSSQAMMVGDTANDVETGRRAGVLTCGVTYGLGGDKLKAARPDFMIDSFPQLLEIIE